MNNNTILSPTALAVNYNSPLTITNATTVILPNTIKICSVSLQYKFIEHIVYLYFIISIMYNWSYVKCY